MTERHLLYATAFARAVSTSLVGVLLGVYLARNDISGVAFGAILSAGLLGAVSAAVAATFWGDRVGRRRFLLVLTAASVLGTSAFALSVSPLALGAAAFLGMLNGMGKDRGAALILEQAALPSLVPEVARTRTIAWYTMLQDLGHGAGAAAWLARRIGLVRTMVFTHLPSSFLLMTVALAPSFEVAALLFLLREGLVEMDVPTRQSYVLAVVQPEERTFASGITNLVRLTGWAVAPLVAGALTSGDNLHVPLLVGAALKILYDLLLWRAFRAAPPPEERLTPG